MFLNNKLKINTYKLPDNKLFKVFDEYEDNYMTDLFELYSIQNNIIYNVNNSTLKDLNFHKEHDLIFSENYSDRFLSSSFSSEIWTKINNKTLNLNMKLKK